MKYLALYRKYRPATFDKVIGQNHIVKILSAQVKNGSVGHAYLFCGTRGTGKTSVAKIFAKAVNCLNPEKAPCGECEVCRALSGENLDIIELDAASNNRVDDIRDIIEKAQYPPVEGRYKVYIIDEVHMLTGAAFNALLKTLEEPPAHTVFILATTEVYKLPATILSRCMRFDFKLVGAEKIARLLKEILNDINKPYEEEAVYEIARAAEGSVRDALSIADTCASYSGEKLLHKDVLELLAAADRGKIAEICHCVLTGGGGAVLGGIDSLCSAGKSVAVLNKDILNYLRDLTVIKNCSDYKKLLIYPSEIFEKYPVKDYDINKILRCIKIFSEIESEIRYSLHPRIILEAAALKAAIAEYDGGIDSFEERLNSLEKKLEMLQSGAINLQPAGKIPDRDIEAKHETGDDAQVIPEQTIPDIEQYQPSVEADIAQDSGLGEAPENSGNKNKNAAAIWGGVIRTLRQQNEGLLYTICGELKAEIEGGSFIIFADNEMAYQIINRPKNIERLKSIIKESGEYNVIVKMASGKKSEETRNADIEKLNDLAEGKLIIED